jgi:TfoX/Sxy family transcriptional regulator of competence genes
MEIPKPTEADKEYFRSVLPDDPEVEVKPMFGNLGAFVHGNMFAGLFGAAVGVRLADADRDELAAVDGAGPFGPAERPMGGYLSLPPAWRADPDRAADWVGRALSHVGAMPTKAPTPSKTRAKSTPRAR